MSKKFYNDDDDSLEKEVKIVTWFTAIFLLICLGGLFWYFTH